MAVILSSTSDETQPKEYDSTYPLTEPQRDGNNISYKICVIADPDQASRR